MTLIAAEKRVRMLEQIKRNLLKAGVRNASYADELARKWLDS